MTPQQQIDWFDQQIAECNRFLDTKGMPTDTRTWYYGKLNGLWESRNRFGMFIALNSQPEPEPTENSFTNGLE